MAVVFRHGQLGRPDGLLAFGIETGGSMLQTGTRCRTDPLRNGDASRPGMSRWWLERRKRDRLRRLAECAHRYDFNRTACPNGRRRFSSTPSSELVARGPCQMLVPI